MHVAKAIQNRKKEISCLIFILGVIIYTLMPTLFIFERTKSAIFTTESVAQYSQVAKAPIGIVFGAGITEDHEPISILKDRLDTAGYLYESGYIEKILLSGNNDPTFDEIDVMSEYMTREFEIQLDDMIYDGYGYRTYDTCKRAKQLYEVDAAILITTGYHLPRAMYLCEESGIKSIGVTSTLRSYYGEEFYYFREILANNKVFLDLFVIQPDYSRELYTYE